MDIESSTALLDQILQKSYKEKPESKSVVRNEVSGYANLSQKFLVQHTNFDIQYAHLYFARLLQLRPLLEKKLKALHLPHTKIIELKNGEAAVTIGTLYKEMKLKPSVLKKLNQDQPLVEEKNKDYISDDDFLFLEDETGRVKLNFAEYEIENKSHSHVDMCVLDRQYSPRELITGLVVAIRGRTDKLGVLYVHKLIFCDIPPNQNDVIFQNVKAGISKFAIHPQQTFANIHDISYYINDVSKKSDEFVAIVSGLNFKYDQSQVKLNALKQFLFGDVPYSNLRNVDFASKITKVVFAGNLIAEERDLQASLQGAYKQQELYTKVFEEMKKTLTILDEFCSELAQNITIDVMPGENDPSDDALPQQPLNRAYFPKSYSNGHLSSVTNPYLFSIKDTTILGTSGKSFKTFLSQGQNITDLKQYASCGDSSVNVMEANLYWRHIAPTAPDTLKYYDILNLLKDAIPAKMRTHSFYSNCPKFILLEINQSSNQSSTTMKRLAKPAEQLAFLYSQKLIVLLSLILKILIHLRLYADNLSLLKSRQLVTNQK